MDEVLEVLGQRQASLLVLLRPLTPTPGALGGLLCMPCCAHRFKIFLDTSRLGSERCRRRHTLPFVGRQGAAISRHGLVGTPCPVITRVMVEHAVAGSL